jgi:uncharacterized protein YjcR
MSGGRVDYGKVSVGYLEGLSDRGVAAKVGCSNNMVTKWRQRNGLLSNYQIWRLQNYPIRNKEDRERLEYTLGKRAEWMGKMVQT